MADAITMQEFKKRNSRFNEQITALQTQTISLQQQEQQKQSAAADTAALEKGIMGRSELQGSRSNQKWLPRSSTTLWYVRTAMTNISI